MDRLEDSLAQLIQRGLGGGFLLFTVCCAWGADPLAWQTLHFGSTTIPEADWTSDPDGDGFTNAEEFVFGGDPNAADHLSAASMASATPGELQFTFHPLIESGALLRIRSSGNLGDWAPVAFRPIEGGDWWIQLAGTRIDVASGTGEISVSIPVAGEDSLFARLEIEIDGLNEEDLDGDGIADWLEAYVDGIPESRDSDGDGVSDRVEILTGKDPGENDNARKEKESRALPTGLEVFTPLREGH